MRFAIALCAFALIVASCGSGSEQPEVQPNDPLLDSRSEPADDPTIPAPPDEPADVEPADDSPNRYVPLAGGFSASSSPDPLQYGKRMASKGFVAVIELHDPNAGLITTEVLAGSTEYPDEQLVELLAAENVDDGVVLIAIDEDDDLSYVKVDPSGAIENDDATYLDDVARNVRQNPGTVLLPRCLETQSSPTWSDLDAVRALFDSLDERKHRNSLSNLQDRAAAIADRAPHSGDQYAVFRALLAGQSAKDIDVPPTVGLHMDIETETETGSVVFVDRLTGHLLGWSGLVTLKDPAPESRVAIAGPSQGSVMDVWYVERPEAFLGCITPDETARAAVERGLLVHSEPQSVFEGLTRMNLTITIP